jgi:hypothetical protein
MSAFQTKAEAEIRKLAKSLKLDADFEYNFSNHGWIWFREGFNAKGCLYVSFQTGYATFAFNRGKRQAQYFVNPDMNWYIEHKNAEQFLSVISYIKEILKNG